MRKYIVMATALIAGLAIAGTEPASAQRRGKRVEKPTAPVEQSDADWTACRGNDLEAKLAACSRIILRGSREPATGLALAYNNRGVVYFDRRDYDGAIRDFSDAVRLNPKNSTFFGNRGHAYVMKGDPDRALPDLDEAVRLNPSDARAMNLRGNAYDAKKDYDRAIRSYDDSIRSNPNDAVVYRNRGDTYYKKGDYDRAIRDLDDSIRLSPSGTGYRWRGDAYLAKKDYDRAIRDFDDAIRLEPNAATHYNMRGVAHFRKNDYDRAIRDFDDAIRLDGKYAVAYSNRGDSYYRKGDYDRAIRDLDEALRINPNYGIAYGTRGEAYLGKNDYDRAIRDLDESIRIDPKSAGTYFSRASAHRGKDDLDRAIRDLDEAIRLDPKYASAYNTRGFIYNQKREYDRAIRDFDEAIRLSPKYANAHAGRGIAYREKGDLGRAMIELEDAIRFNPNYARAYFYRSLVYDRKGDRDRAIADLRRSLELAGGQQDVREALARLEGTPMAAVVPPQVKPAPTVSPPLVTPPSADTGRRVALVIGNGGYRHATVLPNPANDAADMAQALRELGFEVIEGRDLDWGGIHAKVKEFARRLDDASMALFFYAGHGVQVDGRNFLVPVDAKLDRASTLEQDAIDVLSILRPMEAEKRINLVFLDACRDNPFTRSLARSLGASRSSAVGQGLAAIQRASGTLITYATEPGNVAADGEARNSPFTAALLKHIGKPGIEIEQMMKLVRLDVMATTREKQLPRTDSGLLTEVFLKRAAR